MSVWLQLAAMPTVLHNTTCVYVVFMTPWLHFRALEQIRSRQLALQDLEIFVAGSSHAEARNASIQYNTGSTKTPVCTYRMYNKTMYTSLAGAIELVVLYLVRGSTNSCRGAARTSFCWLQGRKSCMVKPLSTLLGGWV
jgi:hypothetical protein